jgi:hypothetical protein
MHDGGLEALATNLTRFMAKLGGEGLVDTRHRVHGAVGRTRVAPIDIVRRFEGIEDVVVGDARCFRTADPARRGQ